MTDCKRGRKRRLKATLVLDVEADFYENDWPGTFEEQVRLTLYDAISDIVHCGKMGPGVGTLHSIHFCK